MFKIYIGNLDKRTTAEHVRRLFVTFTDLEDLVLVEDAETGLSRCFAIAMFRDAERGRAAIAALAGRRLHGRPLTVAEALNKKAKKEYDAKLAAEGGPGMARGPGGPGDPRGPGAASGPGGPRRPFGRGGSSGEGPRGAGGFGGQGGSGGPGGPGGPGSADGARRPGQRPWHRSSGFGGRPFGGGSGGAGGGGPSGRS